MHPDSDLRRWLFLPAPAGASHLVLAQLDRVLKAFRTLDRDAPETLHDFRVAIRRLRSLVKAYQDCLGAIAPKRVRRTLRDIAHATNASRDADVHLEWIGQERDSLRVAERRGADWLRAQLRRDRTEGERDLDRVLTPKAHRAPQRSRKRLRRAVHGAGARYDERSYAEPRSTLAAQTSDQVHRLADTLTRALRAVTDSTDTEAIHSARIAAKHLRYVIEPLADPSLFPGVPAFVERLKSLQDLFGDLHDTTVFADEIASGFRHAAHEGARQVAVAIRRHVASDSVTFHRMVAEAQLRDPAPGLLALAERLQSRHEAGYRRAHDEWLANYGAVAVMPAYELAGALDSLALEAPPLRSGDYSRR